MIGKHQTGPAHRALSIEAKLAPAPAPAPAREGPGPEGCARG